MAGLDRTDFLPKCVREPGTEPLCAERNGPAPTEPPATRGVRAMVWGAKGTYLRACMCPEGAGYISGEGRTYHRYCTALCYIYILSLHADVD